MIARTIILGTAALLLTALLSPPAQAAAPVAKSYSDQRGGKIHFPLGDLSFADEVVSFQKGDPPPSADLCKPQVALGAPDYIDEAHESKSQADCPLGGGGTLVLRFTDNALIDVPGPDLFVFEVGPAIEASELAISPDGKSWINIGKIDGSTATIDIAKFVKPGEVFHYVKLKDLKQSSGGAWSSADIDAVGAIGAAATISLDAAVLFDFNKATLKAAAAPTLHAAAERVKQLPGSTLVFEGHTDNVGETGYNVELSTARANAVHNYMKTKEGVSCTNAKVKGYGESRPVASNTTEEGRAKNRRVEIVIIPKAPKS